MPTITIITITYNAERFLERTIQSIISQKKATDVEYIVIDGGSTDGTTDIIRRYKKHITDWISEPDKGLYDAMNKGLHRASGHYVWFMNAGDEIYDADTLPNLLARIGDVNQSGDALTPPSADVYYSDALFVRDDSRQPSGNRNPNALWSGTPWSGTPVGLRSQVTPHSLPHNLTWQDMALGMKVCHQAFVVRRAIAPDYLINNLSADLDWEIRCLKAAQKTEFVPFVLCRYLIGGLSVQQHRRSLLDRFSVLVNHFGLFTTLINHLRIILRAIQFKFHR